MPHHTESVGAVISHRMDERPLGYASSSLSPEEQKYSQLDSHHFRSKEIPPILIWTEVHDLH